MAQGQICCSYSHKKCKVKYTTKHGTCVSHMLLMTRGYSFYIRIFKILAFVFYCVFVCLFILILQNHIYLCWQKQTAKANKKQGQNKKKNECWLTLNAPVPTEACRNWVTCVYLFCSFLYTQIAPWMETERAPKSTEAEYVHFYFP